MAAVTNNWKVLSVKGKVEVIRQIENGKRKTAWCREFCVVNSMIQMMCKTRTKIVGVFEQKGSRIKGYRKPERSDVDDALLKMLQWKRSDNVQWAKCCEVTARFKSHAKTDHEKVFMVFLSHANQWTGQYCNLSDCHFGVYTFLLINILSFYTDFSKLIGSWSQPSISTRM